jgi:hypothetical protein
MIPAVDIRHDMEGLSARLGLIAKEHQAAAVRALNRTMTTVRAESARALGREYRGLKIGAIKSRIRQLRADRSNLRAVLVYSGKRMRLSNFRLGLRSTRWGTGVQTSGLPARILRVDAISGRARPVTAAELRSAFVQRARQNATPNVWLRQGKESMPIDVLVVPSLSETLVQQRIGEAMLLLARARFLVVFAQEAKFQLSKR